MPDRARPKVRHEHHLHCWLALICCVGVVLGEEALELRCILVVVPPWGFLDVWLRPQGSRGGCSGLEGWRGATQLAARLGAAFLALW